MNHNPKDCLYISDLDGTLLEPHSVFPQSSVDRLNRLIERGLQFTIATARNYDSTHPILRDVRFQLPVILFNGVFLTHWGNGENLELSNFIPHDTVHELLELVLPLKIDPFIYTYGERNRLYYRNASNAGSANYLKSLEGDGRLHPVQKYEFVEQESISGFLLIDTPQNLDPVYQILKRRFSDQLNLYFAEDIAMPGFFWLQAYHREANKGSMVAKLANRLKVPLSQVVVFGDYLNDLEMFKIAGQALAVDNALPEVKQAANSVIGSNAESGVLNYLESLGF